MRHLFILPTLALLQACWHPLEIRGEGDIVERIFGVRGCTYEEFQAGSERCLQNDVSDEQYLVSYQPVPRDGWEFDRWEGTACMKGSIHPFCDYDISKVGVDFFNLEYSDFDIPATVAVFKRKVFEPPADELDIQLHRVITNLNLTGDPRPSDVPSIRSPLAQLGMKLFFSKSLSGKFDTACASCHHPALGGADQLALPVGTAAKKQNIMGPTRAHKGGKPLVGRNSPTTFNSALYKTHLFWDGRVAALESGGISTPDSDSRFTADPLALDDLLAAQARFPVDEPDEMRSHDFMPGADGQAVREHLAARIGDYGSGTGEISDNNWLPEFEAAFGSGIPVEELVTFENIALAISAYQQSQSFVDTPWKAYVQRDYSAISRTAKLGALLFLKDAPVFETGGDGAGCSLCHEGDFFSNEEFDAISMPQIGPGKGDKGSETDDDLGRGGLFTSRTFNYRFRNPSLLNIALTAPYGHAGSYKTLKDVVNHYADAVETLDKYFDKTGWCELEQFSKLDNCANLYPHGRSNTEKAREMVLSQNENDRGMPDIELTGAEIDQIVAFLETLTDTCAADRECVSLWIPSRKSAPDGHQLNARGADGKLL